MSRDVFFNELSIPTGRGLGYEEIEALRGLYLALRSVSKGDFVCRLDGEHLANLVQGVMTQSNGRDVKDFLYAFLRPPFEGDSSEDDQAKYIQSEWRCDNEECFGLAMASILDTLAISINHEPWNVPIVHIKRDASRVSVRNCGCAEHVDAHGEWLESSVKPEPITCGTPPDDKPLKLRDDHGIDVLRAFAKRLLRSEYVVGVVNSLEFHPKARRFIRNCSDDGMVELVLNWTDAGYGLAVQTTGRNRRETEEIARRLEEKFGYIA